MGLRVSVWCRLGSRPAFCRAVAHVNCYLWCFHFVAAERNNDKVCLSKTRHLKYCLYH